jgi:hypothetical protein
VLDMDRDRGACATGDNDDDIDAGRDKAGGSTGRLNRDGSDGGAGGLGVLTGNILTGACSRRGLGLGVHDGVSLSSRRQDQRHRHRHPQHRRRPASGGSDDAMDRIGDWGNVRSSDDDTLGARGVDESIDGILSAISVTGGVTLCMGGLGHVHVHGRTYLPLCPMDQLDTPLLVDVADGCNTTLTA